MEKSKIEKEVKRLSESQEWNHQYELPYNLRTRDKDIDSPGYNTNKWKRLFPIFSNTLENDFKTCLDVGCSDGYYCVEGSRAFKDVSFTGIDLDPIRIERANFIKSLFNIQNAEFFHEDLYDLILKEKRFDVVMGLGLIHRVPDMNKCIEDLGKISNKYLIFEFKSLRSEKSEFIDHGGKSKSNKLNGLYMTPSKKYVENKLEGLGFKCVYSSVDSSSLNFPRLIMVGERNEQ